MWFIRDIYWTISDGQQPLQINIKVCLIHEQSLKITSWLGLNHEWKIFTSWCPERCCVAPSGAAAVIHCSQLWLTLCWEGVSCTHVMVHRNVEVRCMPTPFTCCKRGCCAEHGWFTSSTVLLWKGYWGRAFSDGTYGRTGKQQNCLFIVHGSNSSHTWAVSVLANPTWCCLEGKNSRYSQDSPWKATGEPSQGFPREKRNCAARVVYSSS